MSNLLSVENLTMKFGGLTAIDDLSFDAKNNQITSIIGPNGAGKTTVFNCLTGFYKPTNGQMFLHKEDSKISLRKYTDFKIAYVAKVARTFQNIRLFPAMSVLENLLVAQHNELMVASGYSLLENILGPLSLFLAVCFFFITCSLWPDDLLLVARHFWLARCYLLLVIWCLVSATCPLLTVIC